MKIIIKKTLSRTVGHAFKRDGARIIYFHSILPDYRLATTPTVFKSMLDECVKLKRIPCKACELGDDLRSAKINKDSICITFDDGYLDNYEYAFPILNEIGFKATFFIIAGIVENKIESTSRPIYPDIALMTKQQIIELSDNGMEIGSHTWSHCALRNADKKTIYDELERSKKYLEDLIGGEVTSFCFPNGEVPIRVSKDELEDIIKRIGYKQALTTRWDCITNVSNTYLLSRQIIDYYDTVSDFRAKIMGNYDYMKTIHKVKLYLR